MCTDNNLVQASWNVMAHSQKPDFFFRRRGWVHLNRRGRQFSRLLAVEVCASAVVLLDTPCSEVMWRVPATHSIHQFPLHFFTRGSPRAIIFQLESNSRHITEKIYDTYLLTHSLTNLLAFLLTYLLAYLHTYLLTY